MDIGPLYELYAPIFEAIAAKLTQDEGLRQDCVQEAWQAVIAIPDERVVGPKRDPYIRQAAHYTMLNYLQSYNTGHWFAGRTETRGKGALKQRVRRKPRFISLLTIQSRAHDLDELGHIAPVAGVQHRPFTLY